MDETKAEQGSPRTFKLDKRQNQARAGGVVLSLSLLSLPNVHLSLQTILTTFRLCKVLEITSLLTRFITETFWESSSRLPNV